MTVSVSKAGAALARGFDDYGTNANSVFRTCLDALSRPGTLYPLMSDIAPPAPLLPTAAAILLTLADYETSVWFDEPLAAQQDVSTFVKFHTGATIVDVPSASAFAVVSDAAKMPELSAFALGSPEYPDRSTTIIIQAEALANSGSVFRGPGIQNEVQFSVAPEPTNFSGQLRQNRERFPCGVDLFFVTETNIAALPRSVTLIVEG